MLKKTITYTNFLGETVTEDFYFNISSREVTEMEISHNLVGGYGEMIRRMIKAENGAELIPEFKAFIQSSYGIRSADGKKFYKTPEATADFEASGAYDALFLEFLTQPGAGAEFVSNILPKDFDDVAGKIVKAAEETVRRRAPQDHLPKHSPEPETVQIPTSAPVLEPVADKPTPPRNMTFEEYQAWQQSQDAL